MPFFVLAVVAAVLTGCGDPPVGAPCLPEDVPATGFDPRESYIESSSVQCETRVCIVHQFQGDPREGCVQGAGPVMCPPDDDACIPSVKCVTDQQEIENRIFCTCRCDTGDTGFAECECPDGFSCKEVLDRGGEGIRGGYCINNKATSLGR